SPRSKRPPCASARVSTSAPGRSAHQELELHSGGRAFAARTFGLVIFHARKPARSSGMLSAPGAFQQDKPPVGRPPSLSLERPWSVGVLTLRGPREGGVLGCCRGSARYRGGRDSAVRHSAAGLLNTRHRD